MKKCEETFFYSMSSNGARNLTKNILFHKMCIVLHSNENLIAIYAVIFLWCCNNAQIDKNWWDRLFFFKIWYRIWGHRIKKISSYFSSEKKILHFKSFYLGISHCTSHEPLIYFAYWIFLGSAAEPGHGGLWGARRDFEIKTYEMKGRKLSKIV